MTVYDSNMYRDPMLVAIDNEARALKMQAECGDCAHRREVEFRGEVGSFCEFKTKQFGKRCERSQKEQK